MSVKRKPTQSAGHYKVHLAGICVVALTALAYQVLMTRVFSVMLYYHYAFAGISLAMLGMTVGAQKVFLEKERFAAAHMEEEYVRAALGFSVSSALLIIGFLYCPLFLPPALDSLLLLLFVVPFAYSGICVTLLLTKSDVPVGHLYAADLLGAASGCLGIVGILFLLDPITVTFGLSALTACSAWMMARQAAKHVNLSRGLAALFFILFTAHGALYVSHGPHLGVVWAKGARQQQDLFERWNAFSLIRVFPTSDTAFGWGFGHPQTKPGPQQLGLDIDAQAGTVISRFDGKDLKPFSYLADDVINVGYQVRPASSAAVIGVGGGRDILSALYFGVKNVTGIELNPAIFEALTQRFAGFSGRLDQHPGVSLVNAEARSWLNHADQSFDMIQISLIDTWAVVASSGLTMSENKLYTREAWRDFMERLTPKGLLTVSRWFSPVSHKGEFYRLLSIAAEVLKERGVPPAEINRHILAFSVDNKARADALPGVVTVVVSPQAFTGEEVARSRALAKKYGFEVMVAPGTAWDDVSRAIVSGQATPQYFDALPIDVSAPTDNRPFFFNTIRTKDILFGGGTSAEVEKDLSRHDLQSFGKSAQSVIYVLLAGTFFCTLYFVAVPLFLVLRAMPDRKKMFPYLGYFSGIGLGFMLIEISQMQRLMIFLGHPIFGLTVVLFTLLSFGGCGSVAINALMKYKRFPLALWPASLCLTLSIIGAATPAMTEQFKGASTFLRVLLSVAFLAPAGFCMGMMLPLGMRISAGFRELQPWFWGVNGATSVFASVLGALLSMEFGFSTTFWCGVACYLLCALLIGSHQKTAKRSAA